MGHSLRLGKLWVSPPFFPKLNPSLPAGETGDYCPLSHSNEVYPVRQQSGLLQPFPGRGRQKGAWEKLAPGQVRASWGSYLNLQQCFINKCFSNCSVALIDFQLMEWLIVSNFNFLWRGNARTLYITGTGSHWFWRELNELIYVTCLEVPRIVALHELLVLLSLLFTDLLLCVLGVRDMVGGKRDNNSYAHERGSGS